MLVAGHETTASALTWTMKLLAENPEKLAIVRPAIPEPLTFYAWGIWWIGSVCLLAGSIYRLCLS